MRLDTYEMSVLYVVEESAANMEIYIRELRQKVITWREILK